jgi:C4-type Zn-finger protein
VSRINRILKVVEDLCRFCPICGKELVVVEKKFEAPGLTTVTIDVKVCPGGHGELMVDGHVDGPEVTFAVAEDVWKDID